ncbi:phage head completion protein [Parvularcula maris]|uniref:Head-tail adaptor protein n=1 Tax=Parvularcula maris TaxID=2965077 RepID=A0A9X2L709_9PROT|nr:head-tail adaptor protein [Parvularcula maris]MCQ8184238.1 head-tail adaptor protein [Parvularcula maris]
MSSELSERIEILRPQRVPDGGGGYAIDYVAEAELYAGVQRRGAGRERLAGSVQRQRVRFKLRTESELLYEQRLRHQGTDYRITRISDEGRNDAFALVDAEEVRA